MADIELKNVDLVFPVYNARARSLRAHVLEQLGGVLKPQKKHVTVQALCGINMKLRDGDRVGLIGHNGAGKTTLLRVLSRIYPPSSGTATIRGSISSLTNITLGMDPEATGYDNILFRLIFLGLSFSEAKSKIKEVAEFSGLGDYLHLPLRTYSTGMALRLAFASGTSIVPDILVLDEMIGAGDATFREKSLRRIENTLDAAKILVLASHDLLLLEMYCDQIIWLDKGKIKKRGPTAKVLTAYREALS